MYIQIVFGEDHNGNAHHVMGIVHDAARYLPDLLDYMAEHYPNLTVKNGVLGRGSDIETTTMAQYKDQVFRHYANGTVRHGPLHQISLVGTVHEEVGGFFPDLLARLEANPFLKETMPWGPLSVVQMETPQESNDGPILWIRPGEQLVPTAEIGKSPMKRKSVCPTRDEWPSSARDSMCPGILGWLSSERDTCCHALPTIRETTRLSARNSNHWPKQSNTRRRCVVCRKAGREKRSTIYCSGCDVQRTSNSAGVKGLIVIYLSAGHIESEMSHTCNIFHPTSTKLVTTHGVTSFYLV
ncbi:dioxygenase activity protein [Homalodisca vitripennis]|nr:dioxygenase activity protein [Homalodisca vitripennis]